MQRMPLDIFLGRKQVTLKSCIQSCFYVYFPGQNRLSSFMKENGCGHWVSWSLKWTSGSGNMSSPVVPFITTRKGRSCLWMLPKRGIHECGIAPDWVLLHVFIILLVAKGAEPHLWPISIQTTELAAVERAVLPYWANPFLARKGWPTCWKPSGPPWRAQFSPVWRHTALLQTPGTALRFISRHSSISLMDGSPLKCSLWG